MVLLSILFPWLAFLVRGKLLAGVVCLFLQLTLLGWLPAAIWALVSHSNEKNEKRLKEMEQRIIASRRQ
jgi:uncharacterized membrane protein YqaE (UPF0057 family)